MVARVTEYGLSAFSFSERQKNLFLVIIVATGIILSSMFMLRYEPVDKIEQQEGIDFSNFILKNYDGKILDAGGALKHFRIIKLYQICL